MNRVLDAIAGFKALADIMASFPTLSQYSHFIFIPGPTDPWTSNTLPRPPIPENFVKPVINKVPNAVFTTNPARIRYFNQEIVVFREDLMSRMMRNTVQIKEGTGSAEMKRYVSGTRRSFGDAELMKRRCRGSLCKRSWIRVIFRHSRCRSGRRYGSGITH